MSRSLVVMPDDSAQPILEAIAALESCGDSRVRQRDTQAGAIDLF